MDIEKALECDLEEILVLQKLSYLSEAGIYNDYAIPPLTQTLKDLEKEFEQYTFIKAVCGGKIIGSVRTHVKDRVCTIYKLIVHPDFQNKGLGKSLVKKAEEFNRDCKRFELFTGHKSEKNIHLYQSLGYQIYKTEKLSDTVDLLYLAKDNAP